MCSSPAGRRAGGPASVVSEVDLPVSVLALPGAPTVGELAELGVSRISVGGAIAVAAYGAAINAVTELRDFGTCGYWDLAAVGATRHGGRVQSLTATVTLYLHRTVARQRSHADGRAGVAARLTEDVGQHFARPVHHCGLLVEAWCRRHEPRDGEHPLHAVERAERRAPGPPGR